MKRVYDLFEWCSGFKSMGVPLQIILKENDKPLGSKIVPSAEGK